MKFVRGGKEVWALYQPTGRANYRMTVERGMKQDSASRSSSTSSRRTVRHALRQLRTADSTSKPDSAETGARVQTGRRRQLRVEVADIPTTSARRRPNLKLSQDRPSGHGGADGSGHQGREADAKGYAQTAPSPTTHGRRPRERPRGTGQEIGKAAVTVILRQSKRRTSAQRLLSPGPQSRMEPVAPAQPPAPDAIAAAHSRTSPVVFEEVERAWARA